MNRIDRLSAILIMLQSSSVVRAKQIADRFDISPRTVFRDMKALEEAGIPIVGSSGNGYSLVEGFKLPPLMFTQEEAFAFLAAEKLVGYFADSGFEAGYKSGISKIKAVMRSAEIKVLEDIDDKIAVHNFRSSDNRDSQNILQGLMDRMSKRKKIFITYFSYNKHEVTHRKVDPIGIFFSRSNWYLIAYCNKRLDYRNFRVSRIQNVDQTDEDIDLDHPSLDSFLSSLKMHDDLLEVIIEISKEDYFLIDESKYYQGLVVEKDKKDKIELHFMIFSIERFARWCLTFIDIIEINSPIELKTKIKDILGNIKI